MGGESGPGLRRSGQEKSPCFSPGPSGLRPCRKPCPPGLRAAKKPAPGREPAELSGRKNGPRMCLREPSSFFVYLGISGCIPGLREHGGITEGRLLPASGLLPDPPPNDFRSGPYSCRRPGFLPCTERCRPRTSNTVPWSSGGSFCCSSG